MTEASRRQRDILICVCLALVTTAVYWPVHHFEFTRFDDDLYLTDNPQLRWGLTFRGLRWALTTPLDQWMPVTWVARLLEYQVFGLNPGPHHLVNVLFHIANALLLFGVLKRMTRAPWRSACVAALFALHPLHVESVAWATGLKDVLSMCLSLLAIWAYARYVERLNVEHSTPYTAREQASNVKRRTNPALSSPRPSPITHRPLVRRSLGEGGSSHMYYALTLLLFALALLSKPMVVTLPFVLLLLDYWPLGRTRWAEAAPTQASGAASGQRVKVPSRQLLKEKLPFFALTAAVCMVTYWAQRGFGVVMSLEKQPPGMRIANALLAYADYLVKTFWPTRLAFFYPLHSSLPVAAVIGAAVGLVVVTAGVIWRARRAPWLATGWFWYLGTLVPVIGLVQVGKQSMADRYTYVPLVGLFIMLCWSVPRRALERRTWQATVCVAAAAVLLACAAQSRVQAGYWKNSESLFYHALDVTRDNWLAYYNLGVDLRRMGQVREAVGYFEQAVRIRPDFAEAHNNLGVALTQLDRPAEAIGHYEEALRLRPGLVEAQNNLGAALELTGKRQEAIRHYEEALRLKPDFAEAHYSLGLALKQTGRVPQAIEHYEQALRIKPDIPEVHNHLGVALEHEGKLPEAVAHYEQALRLKPGYAEAHGNLGIALVRLGRFTEAVGHYEQALRIKPNSAEVHGNLGVALVRLGRAQEAIGHCEEALRLRPDLIQAHYNLGLALAQIGRAQDAIRQFEQVLPVMPGYSEVHFNLALALEQTGRLPEAIGHYEEALRLKPDSVEVKNNLAWLLATLASAKGGDPARAVALAQRACAQSGNRVPAHLDTLAAAYAAAGRFDEAIATAQKAIELARSAGQPQVVKEIETRLELYRSGHVYRR